MPKIIVGAVAGADGGLARPALQPAVGRLLTAAEGSQVTVLGSDLASALDVAVGEDTELRGVPFEVVGILQTTLSTPDTIAMVGATPRTDWLPPQIRRDECAATTSAQPRSWGRSRSAPGSTLGTAPSRLGGRRGRSPRHRSTSREA
jgi:MacB-like protein